MFRLITLVLALSAVVLIITGGFWYMWQNARQQAPKARINITAQGIERGALGLYLRYRGDEVTLPADAFSDREVPFVVQPGESVYSVAYNLQALGLVKDPELFRRVVQYWDADGDIQAGAYVLRPNMAMEEIMRELQHGRLPAVTVTIPEGWRLEEIAALLAEKQLVDRDAFIAAARSPRADFESLLDRPEGRAPGVEGFLFPDTYQMPRGVTPERLIEIMLQNWDMKVPQSLRDKAAENGMSLYEVVSLAAIVEREAVVAEERPLIAGVYLNRLRIGMHLQSDPTVQYAKGFDPATGKWWNPMLQEEAITVVSPYNSFLNPGLPPGPICNPGLASIRGVVEPEESQYLFFYAKGDGSHAFALTYEEHLRNEQLYAGQR
jgi:UPF0755 protein